MTAHSLTRPLPSAAPLRLPKPAWAVLGLASLAYAVILIGPWALALWLTPDLAMLAGGRGAFTDGGRLNPRAVTAYNAAHALPGPVALIAIGLVLSPVAFAAGILWLSHVTLDRSLGYGLRAADGSQRV